MNVLKNFHLIIVLNLIIKIHLFVQNVMKKNIIWLVVMLKIQVYVVNIIHIQVHLKIQDNNVQKLMLKIQIVKCMKDKLMVHIYVKNVNKVI